MPKILSLSVVTSLDLHVPGFLPCQLPPLGLDICLAYPKKKKTRQRWCCSVLELSPKKACQLQSGHVKPWVARQEAQSLCSSCPCGKTVGRGKPRGKAPEATRTRREESSHGGPLGCGLWPPGSRARPSHLHVPAARGPMSWSKTCERIKSGLYATKFYSSLLSSSWELKPSIFYQFMNLIIT